MKNKFSLTYNLLKLGILVGKKNATEIAKF